jgi:hypothetical protein
MDLVIPCGTGSVGWQLLALQIIEGHNGLLCCWKGRSWKGRSCAAGGCRAECGTWVCHEGPALPQRIREALPLQQPRCDEVSVLLLCGRFVLDFSILDLTSTIIRTMHDIRMITKVRLKRISGFAKGFDEKQKSILFGKITQNVQTGENVLSNSPVFDEFTD